MMHEAVGLEKQCNYEAALAKYQDALVVFNTIVLQKKSTVPSTPAAAAECRGLEQYVAQLAMKIRSLSAVLQDAGVVNPKAPSAVAPVSAAPSPQSASSKAPPTALAPTKTTGCDSKKGSKAEDLASELDGLAVPGGKISGGGDKKGTPAPDPKPSVHRDPEGPPHQPAAPQPPPPPPPSSSSGPPKKQRPDGPMSEAGANFAPRVSDFVLKAIDVATALVKQGRVKEAVDILQHAFDEGKKEAYNPKNFSLVSDMLVDLRRKYYQQNRPRLLQDNGPTDEEMTLLRRSGRTETLLLPIWDDVNEGYGAENMFMPTKSDQWIDNFTPKLSPKQKQLKCEMKSVREVLQSDGPDAKVQLSIITDADPLNVKQTVVGDCSLVCSLIICASFQHRFPNAKVISSAIYPQDQDGKPIVSRKGKYAVKMLINGITRVVVIDDRLPVEAGTKRLLCTYSKDLGELWVPLMEKAFVKVCGGSYDFPGSNSSTDMYKLSGWLPDSLALDGEGFDAALQWTRLSTCHKKGAVLITANTPQNLDKSVEDHLKLVAGHAYAVLDLAEFNGRQLVKIKNPWSTESSWGGPFSINDKENCTAAFRAAMQYDEEQSAQGVFWIEWRDVVTYFKRLHLSWNPFLLFMKNGQASKPTRIACHSTLTFEFASLGHMPQFHIAVGSAPTATRMHLVFSRHVMDLREYAIEHPEKDTSLPLVAIHVFATSHCPTVMALNLTASDGGLRRCLAGGQCVGRRVVHGLECGDGAQLLNGVYKQVPAHTGSFTCPAGTNLNFTVVIAQHEGIVGSTFPFSLTLHTELPLGGPQGVTMHAIPRADQLEHSTVVKGSWRMGQNCGGKVDSQTFSYNPMYCLKLAAPSRVLLRLASAAAEPVQLFLAMPKRPASAAGAAAVPWHGRLPTVNRDVCTLALQFPMYAHYGCSVDSSLGSCLLFDTTNSLKGILQEQPPTPPPPTAAEAGRPKSPQQPTPGRTVTINIVAGGTPGSIQVKLLHSDTAKVLLVAALAQGVLVSPQLSKIVGEGRALDLSTRLATVDAEKFTVVAGTDELQRSQPLQAAITEGVAIALELLRTVHDVLLTDANDSEKVPRGSSDACAVKWVTLVVQGKELPRLDEKITQLLLRVDGLECPTEEIRACRKTVVGMLSLLHEVVDEIKQEGKRLNTPPQASAAPAAAEKKKVLPLSVPLAPLPAGEYTLIASCWVKGTPGNFELVVQTETPHELREIPAEGAGFESNTVQGQFRNVAFAASSLPTMVPLTGPLLSENLHLTISFGKGTTQGGGGGDGPTLFCARALTIEPDPKAERSSVPILLALYRCDEDGGNASLVVTSGAFSVSGSAIEAMPVDCKSRHVLLVLPGSASTAKFVVRLFCSTKFTALLS